MTCDFESFTDARGASAGRYVCLEAYPQAVIAAGGDPVLLGYLEPGRVKALLGVLDGLVISGGDFDIPAHFYGEQPAPGLGKVNERRSTFEAELLHFAMQADLPTLGVCGGMQLINVVLGGKLYQDLSERKLTKPHEQPGDRSEPFHSVLLVADTLLGRCMAAPTIEVNSTHHQAVRTLGEGVVVTGRADDGVVEAIEVPASRFMIGVQWHPEALAAKEHLGIYRALVGAAASRVPVRGPWGRLQAVLGGLFTPEERSWRGGHPL